MMLQTDDLVRCLWDDPYTHQHYGGVLAIDDLPSSPLYKQKCVYIINTDPQHSPGQHWLLIYFQPDSAEFLDSLGHDIEYYSPKLKDFVFNNRSSYICNDYTYQCKYSDVCGYYCVYFAILRAREIPFVDILCMFTDDCAYNDHIVTSFYQKYMIQ